MLDVFVVLTASVSTGTVRVDLCLFACKMIYKRVQRRSIRTLDNLNRYLIGFPITCSYNRRLIHWTTSQVGFLARMFILFQSAKVRFIYFNWTRIRVCT